MKATNMSKQHTKTFGDNSIQIGDIPAKSNKKRSQYP